MTKSTAEIAGRDFKELIQAVCRFPSVGSFAGADMVNLQVVNERATATAFGIVLSRSRVAASGLLSLIGIERRSLENFCSYVSEKSSIKITLDGNNFTAVSKNRSLELEVSPNAAPHKLPSVKDLPKIIITKDIADRAAYLADVAFNDTSRAELCCVMLAKGGLAIAVDQKTFAVMDVASKADNVAIPLPMAKQLRENDALYLGTKETIVVSGIGTYSMPSPVKAQKDFPLDLVRRLGEAKKEKAAVVEGIRFAEAVAECGSCVGQLARTETILDIATASDKKLHVRAINGGAKYTTVIPALSVKGEFVFRIPLDGIVRATPFMGEKVIMSQGEHGDLYLDIGGGWCLFPGWQDPKKGKKK